MRLRGETVQFPEMISEEKVLFLGFLVCCACEPVPTRVAVAVRFGPVALTTLASDRIFQVLRSPMLAPTARLYATSLVLSDVTPVMMKLKTGVLASLACFVPRILARVFF